ncbi:MAG: dienelactone hydrolase family protein [Gammaproteobacteria bacterium]|nr:dienelactone hydrolase family protein [Gammaproteobacteria bacterium]
MTIETLCDGPNAADTKLILAHGAGQGMDSPFLAQIAERVAAHRHQVVRFNFPYMQTQVLTGKRRPPDREPKLLDSWRKIVNRVRRQHSGKLLIGGKSMGGRMASLLADELQVDGLICLGYPFHPPGKPERLRTKHLAGLQTPTLICQGERDTFGKREEVAHYSLSEKIQLYWLIDGDHSFKPRKASGIDLQHNLDAAAEAILNFIREST